jgi:hypothetical protein
MKRWSSVWEEALKKAAGVVLRSTVGRVCVASNGRMDLEGTGYCLSEVRFHYISGQTDRIQNSLSRHIDIQSATSLIRSRRPNHYNTAFVMIPTMKKLIRLRPSSELLGAQRTILLLRPDKLPRSKVSLDDDQEDVFQFVTCQSLLSNESDSLGDS